MGLQGEEDGNKDDRGYRKETRSIGTHFGQHGCVSVLALLLFVRFVVMRERAALKKKK